MKKIKLILLVSTYFLTGIVAFSDNEGSFKTGNCILVFTHNSNCPVQNSLIGHPRIKIAKIKQVLDSQLLPSNKDFTYNENIIGELSFVYNERINSSPCLNLSNKSPPIV